MDRLLVFLAVVGVAVERVAALAGVAFFVAALAGVAFLAVALAGVAFFVAALAGVAFLAVVFFAAAPAAAATAADAVPAEARVAADPVLASFFWPETMSLKLVPARNFGMRVFLILTVSPVLGLRPVRAARFARSNVPKPVMPTLPPLATSRMTMSRTASRASEATLRLPSLASRAPISSALFTSSLQRTVGVRDRRASGSSPVNHDGRLKMGRGPPPRASSSVVSQRVWMPSAATPRSPGPLEVGSARPEPAWCAGRSGSGEGANGRRFRGQEAGCSGVVTGLCEGRDSS